MSKVYWILANQKIDGYWEYIFIGTRTTEKAAVKLAVAELMSNKWDGPIAPVYEATYDSYGNIKEIVELSIVRSGKIVMKKDMPLSGGYKNGLLARMRKQYGIDRNGYLVKNKVEPAKYSIIEM